MSADASTDARRILLLTALRDALGAVERGDDAAFERAFTAHDDAIARPLYALLVKARRELREALASIPGAAEVARLAGRDLPNARERLDFVLKATEQAAHRSLDIADAMRVELGRIAAPPPVAAASRAALERHLSALYEAQAFQDLTGQAIRRVVDVVARAEQALNDALAAAGIEAANDADASADARAPARSEHGAASQSDVDALLAGLGL